MALTGGATMSGALLLFAALLSASSVNAATPAARFDEATRYDLEGKPQLAFEAYLDAAEAGLPDAEFNVAIMLDSGRGVTQEPAQAALWYSRAAAHGLARAAYNLGQLYEAGQGVPQNAQLARAWFEASQLPASHDHLRVEKSKASNKNISLAAPVPMSPVYESDITKNRDGVELVWTSQEEPMSTIYYVELYTIEQYTVRMILAKPTSVTSILFKDHFQKGNYLWRVTALETRSQQYAASKWVGFKVE